MLCGGGARWIPVPRAIRRAAARIGYRGSLVTRAADVFGRSGLSYRIAVLLVSVLFGIGHWYKGPSGVIDSGIAGLIIGCAYLASGRNLWTCILAHASSTPSRSWRSTWGSTAEPLSDPLPET